MSKIKRILLFIMVVLTITSAIGINTFAGEVDDPIGLSRVAPYMETIK